jgi:glycosyltransferase involved in cell wall biosynthesis
VKILWHSNAGHVGSGYGSQTNIFTRLLKEELGHDVAISAFWGVMGGETWWNGIRVYPADGSYGGELLPIYATHHAAGNPADCTIITLMDVWALAIPRANPALAMLPMASWVPVDHDPTPENVRKFFELIGSIPIAMSRFGERMLRNDGLDPVYVPHGVDTRALRPIDRDAAREALGIPSDAFVVGMVAANQGNKPPRKAFPQAFDAFARFRAKHDDALLYLHTQIDADPERRAGVNLLPLAEALKVPLASLVWTPEINMRLGVPYGEMAALYSCFDVLLCPSYGEGFGIPIVEAQACGVPVIVNDFSAMPELCGAGWKVDGHPYFDFGHGGGASYFQDPDVASIVDALEAAYAGARDAGLRERAREFAEGYDVNRVLYDYWVPALAEIDDRLAERRELLRRGLEERAAA